MSNKRDDATTPDPTASGSTPSGICPGFFITGTGTDVGKTYVGAILAKSILDAGRKVGVYKPVASGCELVDGQLVARDAEQLWVAAAMPKTLRQVTPQCFAAPLAPNVAARKEGRRVDSVLLRNGLNEWMDSDCLFVEGVGGLMSPISDDDLVVDLAVEFGFPLIVVVANRLGCINETLLTLRVAKDYGLKTLGVILNDVSPRTDESASSNIDEIQRLTELSFVERLSFGQDTIGADVVRRLLA